MHTYKYGSGGYVTAGWHNSKLIRDVRDLDPNVTHLDERPCGGRALHGQESPVGSTETVLRVVGAGRADRRLRPRDECHGSADFVWFVPNYRTYLYSIDELRQRVTLTPIKTERDGVIYRVTPKAGGARPTNC